jgi:hypothetical protein
MGFRSVERERKLCKITKGVLIVLEDEKEERFEREKV